MDKKSGNVVATTLSASSSTHMDAAETQLHDFLDKVTMWGARSDNLRSPGPSPKKSFDGFASLNVHTTQPNMQLKPYQVEGVHWLLKKHRANVNCVLADEMV